jgi:ferredoxin
LTGSINLIAFIIFSGDAMVETLEAAEPLVKMEPMSHGRTDLRKKKPKIIAVILDNCTGCAGSPACAEYCPVEACMFWVPDMEYPPAGRIEVDPNLCIGCKLCTSKGPDGTFLEGCPWDAIEMMPVEEWEGRTGFKLNP